MLPALLPRLANGSLLRRRVGCCATCVALGCLYRVTSCCCTAHPARTTRSTLEFAKSQLEWMNEALTRSLGHARDNPFNTRWVPWPSCLLVWDGLASVVDLAEWNGVQHNSRQGGGGWGAECCDRKVTVPPPL